MLHPSVHRTARLAVLLLGALTFSGSAGAGPAPAATARASVNYSFDNKPLPRWENGFLLGRDYDQYPALVLAFDRSGRLANEGKVSVPGAVRIFLRTVAASRDGALATSGAAWTAQGVAASFIAWISTSGAVERVVRTEPFGAERLCFSPDGTLWAAGREHTPDFRSEVPHDVLRQYDAAGRLVRSALSRASFAQYERQHPAMDSFLMASDDRIGLYSVTAREWVELSLSGDVLSRWQGVDLPSDTRITGAALTSDDSVYVVARSSHDVKGGSPFFRLYRLDRQSRGWTAVDGAKTLGIADHFRLLGADGRDLIISTRFPELLWVRPQ